MSSLITELWVFTAIDPADSSEGVVEVQMDNEWHPLVAADRARMESLRPVARAFASSVGAKVTLKRFSVMTVEETYEGRMDA